MKFHIVVLDNDLSNSKIITHALGNNYNYTLIKNSNDSYDIIRRINPDLILITISIIDAQCLLFCKQIKENSETNSIPILLITSTHVNGSLSSVFDSGFIDIIHTPLNKVELQIRVKNYLDLKHTHDELKRLSILTPNNNCSKKNNLDSTIKVNESTYKKKILKL